MARRTKHAGSMNIPDEADPGTVRVYAMRVTDVCVAGGQQHVHLEAIDAPEVFVDTVIANPDEYLCVGDEHLIRVTIGAALPDDTLS
jgi:hypothetical protein